MGAMTIEVGLVARRPVRGYLERVVMLGWKIRWHESRGLFYRTFTVSGPDDALADVRADVENFVRERRSRRE